MNNIFLFCLFSYIFIENKTTKINKCYDQISFLSKTRMGGYGWAFPLLLYSVLYRVMTKFGAPPTRRHVPPQVTTRGSHTSDIYGKAFVDYYGVIS